VIVAINLIGLPSTHQGGAGFYAGTLIRSLAASGHVRLRIVAARAVLEELSGIVGPVDAVAATATRPSRARRGLDAARSLRDPRLFDAQPQLTGALRGCDVVHYPLSFMAGPLHQAPSVVTGVDLQHLAYPTFFPRLDRVLRRLRWHPALRRAQRIIAFSEFGRQELVRGLQLDPAAIDVVHAACADEFFMTPPVAPRRDLGRRYLFYPASPLPAKNHGRLLEAFARVIGHPDVGGDLDLVLSGPLGHDWSAVHAAVTRLSLEDRVVLTGHTSLEELRGHYAGATAMIFPSLYEGFGIPLVEAMASGCPIAASDVASVPEVVGDGALLLDPTDVGSIERGIIAVIQLNAVDRTALIQRGRSRARRFDARSMADATLATYERVVA